MTRVRLNFNGPVYRQIKQSAAVRRALAKKADEVAGRARSIASAEGADVTIRRSSGNRRGGRPYERVESPDGAAHEFGTSLVDRKRILGRAGESS